MRGRRPEQEARLVGGEEVRRGAAFRDDAVERGRFDDQVDDAEERRRRRLVRAGVFTSEMVGETEPAFRLSSVAVAASG